MIHIQSINKRLTPIELPTISNITKTNSITNVKKIINDNVKKIFKDIEKIQRSKDKIKKNVDMYNITKIKEFARILGIKVNGTMKKNEIIDLITNEYIKYMSMKEEEDINQNTVVTYGNIENDDIEEDFDF